jgi:hypothetical protein
MRHVNSIFFAAVMLAWLIGPVCAAAPEPVAGAYVVSGVIGSVSGGSACGKKGEKLSGYSYWPANQGSVNFTVVIPPVAPASGLTFYFPHLSRFTGSVWKDVLTFAQPPRAVTEKVHFTLSFTAFNATSFSTLLRTAIGACATSYTLNFKLGLPVKLF